MKAQSALLRASMWIFVACGIWLVGLGGYFMFVRPPLLPEDLRYIGSSATQVDALLPNLASWLQNVFTVMGGFMAGCGVLVVFASVRVVPHSVPGTGIAFGFTGLFTVSTMSWINFALDSDFKWLLLVPALAWSVGLVTYATSRLGERAIVATVRTKTDALP